MLARNLIALLIIGSAVYVMSPLLLPVLMGGVLAILMFPWLERLERRKLSTNLGASLLISGMTLLFIAPTAVLLFIGARATLEQVRAWRDGPLADGANIFDHLAQLPFVQRAMEHLSHWLPADLEGVGAAAADLGKQAGLRLADALGNLVTYLPGATVSMAIMVISTYFFMVDGRSLAAWVRRHSVFDPRQTERILASFAGICRSVILATVMSGLIQSVLYALVYLIVGGKNVPLIGFLVFLASFVPLVGAAPVTFGVAIGQMLSGHRSTGIVLLIAAAVVSLVDNVVRPIVLKGAANLHPLVAFVAVFGGLQVMGFTGVFIGPILAALAVSVLQTLLDPVVPALDVTKVTGPGNPPGPA